MEIKVLIHKRLKVDINAKGGNTQNEALGLCKPLNGGPFHCFLYCNVLFHDCAIL